MKILIVEDEAPLANGLRFNFEQEGYEAVIAGDGATALQEFEDAAEPFDLIILDLMLPGLDGLRVLRALRADGHAMPVLVLTARDAEPDKVRGLKLGADDYVTKPFGLMELLARVEALLRRAARPARALESAVTLGAIVVDPLARTVHREGQPVQLTPKEMDLLVALLARRGVAVPRSDLMRQVWGYDASVVSRTLDTHVAELRRKLEDDPAAPRWILTVRKLGYRVPEDGAAD